MRLLFELLLSATASIGVLFVLIPHWQVFALAVVAGPILYGLGRIGLVLARAMFAEAPRQD